MNLDYVQNFEADEKLRKTRELRAKDEGKMEEKIEIAKNLLKNNVSLEIISNSIGLTIEKLNELKEEIL